MSLQVTSTFCVGSLVTADLSLSSMSNPVSERVRKGQCIWENSEMSKVLIRIVTSVILEIQYPSASPTIMHCNHKKKKTMLTFTGTLSGCTADSACKSVLLTYK